MTSRTLAALLATAMMVMNARAEDAPRPSPSPAKECHTLIEAAKDIAEHSGGPGQFVKLTRDQTIWARGFFVAMPPSSKDPGTDDAFLWKLPENRGGLVFFATAGLSCASMLIPPDDVALLLEGGT